MGAAVKLTQRKWYRLAFATHSSGYATSPKGHTCANHCDGHGTIATCFMFHTHFRTLQPPVCDHLRYRNNHGGPPRMADSCTIANNAERTCRDMSSRKKTTFDTGGNGMGKG